MQTFILSDIWSTIIKYFSDDNMSARYLKPWPINQRWQCWDSFETKDNKRCILAHFEQCFVSWKWWGNVESKMVHSDAIRIFVLSEVGTAENILKSRTIYGAFWRYFKWCSWSWNCWEKIKSKDAKWWILALFKTILMKKIAEKMWKAWKLNDAFWRYSKRCFGSWNCLENVEVRKLNGTFGRFSKNAVDEFPGSYRMWKYVHHWNNS